MRNRYFPVIILFFVASCSGDVSTPDAIQDKQVPLGDSSLTEKIPVVRPSFRKAVLAMLAKNWQLANTDTFEIIPEGEYFSLTTPGNILSGQDMIYLKQGETVRVRFQFQSNAKNPKASNMHEIILEEHILLSTQDVDRIIAAMSKKVTSPYEERFLKRPFTFWQFENAICHLFTAEEKHRKLMDLCYEEWVKIQSPGE